MAGPDPAAGGAPASDAAALTAAAAAAANSPSQPEAAAAAASLETPAGETPAGEKPAAEKPAAEKPAAEKPAAETPAGAPEKYALQLPATANTVAIDAADLTRFEEMARANNLTNEQAQQVLNGHAERVTAQHKAWADATSADREIGGAQLETTRQQTTRLVDEFMPATDPDRAALDQMLAHEGLGNRLPLVKLLARIARGRVEDPTLGRQRPAEGTRSAAEVMFSNMNKK